MKIDLKKYDNADEHMCADCGLSFVSGDERDDHFMSSNCLIHTSNWNEVIHKIRYAQSLCLDRDLDLWDHLEEIADTTTELVMACVLADKYLRGDYLRALRADATAQQLRAALDKITIQ